MDPYLYPSLLYLVGFLKHTEKPEIMDDEAHAIAVGEISEQEAEILEEGEDEGVKDETEVDGETKVDDSTDKAQSSNSSGFGVKEIINANDVKKENQTKEKAEKDAQDAASTEKDDGDNARDIDNEDVINF